MAPAAAYDEIAGWYETHFLSGLRAKSDGNPTGLDGNLREPLGH